MKINALALATALALSSLMLAGCSPQIGAGLVNSFFRTYGNTHPANNDNQQAAPFGAGS